MQNVHLRGAVAETAGERWRGGAIFPQARLAVDVTGRGAKTDAKLLSWGEVRERSKQTGRCGHGSG
jgi:hypothetical protein